jgi:uncharacterized protein (DUF2147 family)
MRICAGGGLSPAREYEKKRPEIGVSKESRKHTRPAKHNSRKFGEKPMKAIYRIVMAASAIAMAASAAQAAGVNGTWLRPKTGKHVLSYSCGGGLGLKVVATGKVIMCGAKAVGANKYEGTLTSTEDGNQYSGTVTIAGNKLLLSGCVLGGLICKSETWKRIN